MVGATDRNVRPQPDFGTFEFFRQLVLYGGDFKEAVKQEVGSEAVVEAVAKNKFAIGYSGIGYKTSGVRAVPVASYFGGKCYGTSADETYSGKYPILVISMST